MFVYLNIIITPYYYHYICLYISYYAVVQRPYFFSWSKNVLTHTFLFENWPYTYIFIFMIYLFLITPTYLQTIIVYSFKVLLCSFIEVYWNEAIKQISKKTELQIKCNGWSFIQITLSFKLQRKLSVALT